MSTTRRPNHNRPVPIFPIPFERPLLNFLAEDPFDSFGFLNLWLLVEEDLLFFSIPFCFFCIFTNALIDAFTLFAAFLMISSYKIGAMFGKSKSTDISISISPFFTP